MHAYYEDLICFVRHDWSAGDANLGDNTAVTAAPLPPPPLLEDIFSTCYQASMLQKAATRSVSCWPTPSYSRRRTCLP